jgi:hypothetical protein
VDPAGSGIARLGYVASATQDRAATWTRTSSSTSSFAGVVSRHTAGLIDEIHVAISPVLLGRGEHLFAGIDMLNLGYKCTEHVSTNDATHVVLAT